MENYFFYLVSKPHKSINVKYTFCKEPIYSYNLMSSISYSKEKTRGIELLFHYSLRLTTIKRYILPIVGAWMMPLFFSLNDATLFREKWLLAITHSVFLGSCMIPNQPFYIFWTQSTRTHLSVKTPLILMSL